MAWINAQPFEILAFILAFPLRSQIMLHGGHETRWHEKHGQYVVMMTRKATTKYHPQAAGRQIARIFQSNTLTAKFSRVKALSCNPNTVGVIRTYICRERLSQIFASFIFLWIHVFM